MQSSAVPALHDAVRRGDVDAVKALLRNVVKCGDVDAVKALLRSGADVDAQNMYGFTAVHFAVLHGNVDVLEALIAAGADVDVKDVLGYTPLHSAADFGLFDCVKALVHSGAAMDVHDRHGDTALDYFWNSCYREYSRTACMDLLTSPSMRRTNTLARVARFAVFAVFDDLYYEFMPGTLYESLFERVLLAVESRSLLAECRLVCKAWRRGCDRTLAARPVEFFAPAVTAVCP
jgi:hypothetical protein